MTTGRHAIANPRFGAIDLGEEQAALRIAGDHALHFIVLTTVLTDQEID